MRICRLTLTTWAFNGFLCTTLGKLEATAAPLISTWQKLRQVERILQKPQSVRTEHTPAGRDGPIARLLGWKVFHCVPVWQLLRRPFCRRLLPHRLFARPTCRRTTWDAAADIRTFALHLDTRKSPLGAQKDRKREKGAAQKVNSTTSCADAAASAVA